MPVADTLAALVETLMTFDAETTRADLRAAQRVLSSIKESLEDADEADEADEVEDADDADEVEDADEAGESESTTTP